MQVSISNFSKADGKRLVELVAIINANVNGFIAVGNALAEIKKDRLYRETHSTFESYCNDLWGFNKTYSYDLVESSRVMNRLVNNFSAMAEKPYTTLSTTVLPTSERQARELAKVEDHEQAEVWAKVVEAADKPTAKVVNSVVKQWNKLKEKLSPKPKEDKKTEAEIIEEPEVASESAHDTVSDSKTRVFKRDAPMPEWFMDDNSVAVPLELYPVWRAKQRFFELANSSLTQGACDQIVSLSQELNYPATIAIGHEMWTKLSRFQNEFGREIASGEPHVLSTDKTTWLSKREVKNV